MEVCGGAGGGGYPVVSYLLQQTLRRLCTESDWVYAVFWRILPRNYPPPKWDSESSVLDRSKGNKRNWILVWEDGFCDFVACAKAAILTTSENTASASLSHNSDSPDHQLHNTSVLDQGSHNIVQFMQPELFFKMSHEVYNFGEGLMGKVAADNSHKWIYKEPMEADSQYANSSWQGTMDPHPRTWEAQFKSGIETIAIVAVKEGVLQLGSMKKISEDLNLVLSLQRKFNYLQSIPGVYAVHPVLMQHATSSRAAASLPPAVADSWPSDPPHHRIPADHWLPDHHFHYQQPCHSRLAATNQQAPPKIGAGAPAPPYHVMQSALPAHCQAMNQRLPINPLDGMQASLQALLLRLPSVTADPPPSTASSSSTSPTGHPYNINTQQGAAVVQRSLPAHHQMPAHQHSGFTPTTYTSQPLSTSDQDQELDPATTFFKGRI